jgi:uncharacterized membrane-anchored protein
MQRALFLVGLVLAVGVPLAQIALKEQVLQGGQLVLLELAPVDPRSLIQGDYMRLNYAINNELRGNESWPQDGHVVVKLDENQVAKFVRRDAGESLGPGEHRIRYRRRSRGFRIGTDAFYFQEGHASRYESAKYGEVRLAGSGESVLVGLRDARRQPLGGDDRP